MTEKLMTKKSGIQHLVRLPSIASAPTRVLPWRPMEKTRARPENTSVGERAGGRRILQFESVDDVLSEVERLVEADRAGRLQRVGNWSLGQTLAHLAAWAEYSYTGSPLKVPFFVRWFARPFRRRFLYRPMPAGVKIPRVPGGTYATEPATVEEALPRLQQVLTRLKQEPPVILHPAIGSLRHEEWIALNLRHAELHLSFFVPPADPGRTTDD